MVRLSAANLAKNYEHDDTDDSSTSSAADGDMVMKGYVKNENNVLVPVSSLSSKNTTPTVPSSDESDEGSIEIGGGGGDQAADDESDDESEEEVEEEEEEGSINVGGDDLSQESEGGWSAGSGRDESENVDVEGEGTVTLGVPKALIKPSNEEEAAEEAKSEEQWKFDLENMEKEKQKEEKAKKSKRRQTKSSSSKASVGDEKQALTTSMHSAADDTASRASSVDEYSFISTESAMGGESKASNDEHLTPEEREKKQKLRAEKAKRAEEHIEKRRKQRAARMEKVRERIAREKEEEKTKKAQEERDAREADMTEDSRRQRAYYWWQRCGMIKRDEMKKRVNKDMNLKPDDVDLLPWNFNGTMVNASKMMKYQLNKK